jgi:hypothetical protein
MSDPVPADPTGPLTWDLTPTDGGPRRASLADIGGATVENDDDAPDEATMIHAGMMNRLQRTAAAHDKAIPALVISVHFTAGTPAITQATGPAAAAIPGTFTVVDNGAGDTTIKWPVDTFPPSVAGPTAGLNDLTLGSGIACALGTFGGLPGVRVKTWDGSNNAADRDFTVTIR